MKHQYFGDVNDYRKYGLLRVLQRVSGLRLGVCWMLTPDDGRADGKFIDYLNQPRRWRSFDPELFDALVSAVSMGRRLGQVVERSLLPGALFFDELIPDQRAARSQVMSRGRALLTESELAFFDPDNGMEVRSCGAGNKDSSRYTLWAEVADQFARGKSVLVYQHFPREKRDGFVARMSEQFLERIGCETIVCFRTKYVAFFLLIHHDHRERLLRASKVVAGDWAGKIEVVVGPSVPASAERTEKPQR
jgi:hypothetical protein